MDEEVFPIAANVAPARGLRRLSPEGQGDTTHSDAVPSAVFDTPVPSATPATVIPGAVPASVLPDAASPRRSGSSTYCSCRV